MPTYTFRIQRTGEAGARREFKVELEDRMTVLDGLFEVQRKLDPSLSFRCSCRVGMCGTCGMFINAQPRLACQTRALTLDSDLIDVRPLPHLPVLKDLVVSLEPFFAQWKRIRPKLHRAKNKDPKRLAIVPPESRFGREHDAKWNCITCACCYSACGIVGANSKYVGPAAINKAMLRLLDPRDENVADRLKVLDDSRAGVWRCHTQFNCVAACPKKINLTDSIMSLKRAMLRPGKFHDKLRDPERAEV
jgi:succinate dehydrogenase/fumarate reductase iron-sulfur protein